MVLVFGILISSFTHPDMTCAVSMVLKGSNQSSIFFFSVEILPVHPDLAMLVYWS